VNIYLYKQSLKVIEFMIELSSLIALN